MSTNGVHNPQGLSLAIPGLYRPAVRPRNRGNKNFDVINGARIEKAPIGTETGGAVTNKTLTRDTLRGSSIKFNLSSSSVENLGSPDRLSLYAQKKSFEMSGQALPFAPESALPSFLAHDLYGHQKEVLTFSCYFQESLDTGDIPYRIRKCVIVYHLSDNTLKISETKVANSGRPDGAFLKRHKVPKQGGGFIGLEDLVVGSDVRVYERVFRIVDCCPRTRAYFESVGLPNNPAEAFPADFQTFPAPSMGRSKSEGTVFTGHNRKATPLKTYMEARLGKCVTGEGLKSFLENDGHVLRFYCEWEKDTDLTNAGIAQKLAESSGCASREQFVMHFFLTDDTVEIRQQPQLNDGRVGFPLLLKRSKLPRQWEDVMAEPFHDPNTDPWPKGTYYKADELRLGSSVKVWGRNMRLCSADESTMKYYRTVHGVEMTPFERPVVVPEPVRPKTPEYAGLIIGAEDDGYGAFAKKNNGEAYRQMMRDGNKVLRWSARILTKRPEDGQRRFVISWFCADNTVSVFENPQGNSGITGGKFLDRAKLKVPAHLQAGRTNSFYEPADFFIGNRVEISATIFEIMDMDKFTLKLALSRPEMFPWADVRGSLMKLGAALSLQKAELLSMFQGVDASGSGAIAVPDARAVFSRAGDGSLPLTTQEMVCVMCAFDRDGSGKVDYTALVNAVYDPSREQDRKGYTVPMSPVREMQRFAGGASLSEAQRDVLVLFAKSYFTRQTNLKEVFGKYDKLLCGQVSKLQFESALQLASVCSELGVSNDEISSIANFYFPAGVRSLDYGRFLDLLWQLA